jgi:hypothetical protein
LKEQEHVINQHYVPRSILKFFKESDEVFNKKKKRIFHVLHTKGTVYPSTIDQIMSGEYFYEHPDFALNKIEGHLQRFEDWYSRIHGNLVSLVSEYEEGRAKFSKVLAQVRTATEPMVRMHLRSGAMMYELKFWHEAKRSLDSLHGMLSRFQNRNYTHEFANALNNFHQFCVLKSANKNFVISDQYLATASLSFKGRFINSTNRTIGLKDVIVLLPISKSYYLCFYNGAKPDFIRPNQLRFLSQEQTDSVNRVIMNNSYVQTAGPNSDVLTRIIKDFNEVWPTSIYYGGSSVRGGAELRKEVFYYERDQEIYEFADFPHEYSRYLGVLKNDPCPCTSGEIYSNCCRFKVRAFNKFMETVKAQSSNPNYNPYLISGCYFHELNIFEYSGRS